MHEVKDNFYSQILFHCHFSYAQIIARTFEAFNKVSSSLPHPLLPALLLPLHCVLVCFLHQSIFHTGFKTKDDSWIAVIQKIYIHEEDDERIRFGYYSEGKFISRPLELPEKDVPELFKGAIEAGIFEQKTIETLKEIINN